MPATVRTLVAGDVGITDDIEFEGVVNLTGVTTIVGHVWRAAGPLDPHDLLVEILDADNRIIRVHYGDAGGDWLPSQTEARSWLFDVEAAWPGQAAVTSPRRTPVTLNVRASHAAPEEP